MHTDLQAGLLNSLTGEALAIDPAYWQNTLSELSLLSTTGITGAEIAARKAEALPRLLTASGGQVNGGEPANLNSSAATPARSIAHLQLSGFMLATDFLFYRGINHLTAALLAAEHNPNIAGVLLEVNSGGGQATAGDMLMATLATMKKPVVVLAHYMASAAVLGSLPAAAIVASSQGTMVGSIGTYIQISKAQLQSEKHNYKTIYAKESTNKNKQRRAAMDGDFKPYQELVNKFNTMFLQNVRKYRRLTVDAAGTLSGEMFFAADAKRRGLIDQVGTFSQAIRILSQKINQQPTVRRSAARSAAPRKPAPPRTPNAGRSWLNSPINQQGIAIQLGVKYDPKVLREAPAANTKTSTTVPASPVQSRTPNAGRSWLNNPIQQKEIAKTLGVEYDPEILREAPTTKNK